MTQTQTQTRTVADPTADRRSPVTVARVAAPGRWRSLLRSVDEYTLWAFNPQPPLVGGRRTDRTRSR